MSKGKVNIYRCASCNHPTVTLDIHEGTTPFFMRCRNCNVSMAQSLFYRVPQTLDADYLWIRPTTGEFVDNEHVKNGGLIPVPAREPLRPCDIQKQPNPATCLVTAFAMVINVPVAELIEQIGHDGTDIAFPSEEGTKAYRGHHIQEIIYACFQRGYAITPFEPLPSMVSGTSFIELPQLEWFDRVIQMRNGVLAGSIDKSEHSVALINGETYNPANKRIGRVHNFRIRTFYAVVPVASKIKSTA